MSGNGEETKEHRLTVHQCIFHTYLCYDEQDLGNIAVVLSENERIVATVEGGWEGGR